jgi:NitT/TauT family transport system permease protein
MIRRAVITLIILALWQSGVWLHLMNPQLISSPLQIAQAALRDGGVFMAALRVTLFEIICAAALAWCLGLMCGVGLGASRQSALCLSPVLSSIIALPLVVLYPVIVAWTGIGPMSKIIYGAAAGFFPIALSTLSGVSAIDQRYVVMARAMGASRLRILTDVMARLALPSIMAGLRVGTSLLIIAIIQSEMLSATDGLGFWISYHRSLFNVGQVYFGVGLVLCLAALVNALLVLAEKKLHFHMS